MNSDKHDEYNNFETSTAAEWCFDLEDLPLRMEELRRVQLVHQLTPALNEFYIRIREGGISKQEADALRATIEHARGKRDIRRFLEKHPHILAQSLDGEDDKWCIPEKRLGSECAPDFLLAELSSIGLEWCGVELESPHAKLFKKNGDPSSSLTHAVRQATDWRTWLRNNIDYARRPRDKNGLNLIDIDSNLPFYILIGSRRGLDDRNRERRHNMNKDLNIQIHTYDWLIEVVEYGQTDSN